MAKTKSTEPTPGTHVMHTDPIGGLLRTGVVVSPTRADRDRRINVHGVSVADPMVLVQWGYWRSWEYCSDITAVTGQPGDL